MEPYGLDCYIRLHHCHFHFRQLLKFLALKLENLISLCLPCSLPRQDFGEDADSGQPGLHPHPLHPHRNPGEDPHGGGPLLLRHHGNHLVHQL